MSERGTKERQRAYHHIRKLHTDTLALLDNYEIYGKAKVIEKLDNLAERVRRARAWMQWSGVERPKRADCGYCGNGASFSKDQRCPKCGRKGKR